jgi:hypothetical protein
MPLNRTGGRESIVVACCNPFRDNRRRLAACVTSCNPFRNGLLGIIRLVPEPCIPGHLRPAGEFPRLNSLSQPECLYSDSDLFQRIAGKRRLFPVKSGKRAERSKHRKHFLSETYERAPPRYPGLSRRRLRVRAPSSSLSTPEPTPYRSPIDSPCVGPKESPRRTHRPGSALAGPAFPGPPRRVAT